MNVSAINVRAMCVGVTHFNAYVILDTFTALSAQVLCGKSLFTDDFAIAVSA